MFVYESKDGEKNVEVESASIITADSELAIFLVRHLQAINTVAPIDEFKLTKTSDDVSPVFDYDILLQDGRMWHQTMTFPAGASEPTMTFAVTDQWKLSEFALQRPLRDLIVRYVFSHAISRIEVTWL